MKEMQEKEYTEIARKLYDKVVGYPANDFGKDENGHYTYNKEEISYYRGMEFIAYHVIFSLRNEKDKAAIFGMLDAIKIIFEKLLIGE